MNDRIQTALAEMITRKGAATRDYEEADRQIAEASDRRNRASDAGYIAARLFAEELRSVGGGKPSSAWFSFEVANNNFLCGYEHQRSRWKHKIPLSKLTEETIRQISEEQRLEKEDAKVAEIRRLRQRLEELEGTVIP